MGNDVDSFLAHYGVKGMKWGVRKASIKQARRDRASYGDKVGDAEQAFLRARKSGDKRRTASAERDLQRAHREEETNKLKARTLTRGEQAVAVVLLGPIGIGGVAINAIRNRDTREIKPYAMRILNNVDPED